MANVSNDSFYALTNTGGALTTAATNLPNLAGPISLLLSVTQSGAAIAFTATETTTYLRDGLCLSDFADPSIAIIGIPVNPLTLPSSSLIGAISESTGDPTLWASDWIGGNSYAVGNNVNYYNGNDVTIYKCISAISPSTTTPPLDTTHWSYVGKAFSLRLIPAESGMQPGLQGGDRFFHYAKFYGKYVDTSGAPYFILNVPGAGYTTWATTTNGIQNSQIYDTSPNTNVTLGLPNTISLTGTISGATATFTHSNTTFPRILSGTKVKVRGASGVTIPFVLNLTSATTTGFAGTISTTGTWSSTTQYVIGDYVTYTPSGGSLGVYYASNQPAGTGATYAPTNTTYWTKLTGSITGGTVDPIISNWQLFLETTYFEQQINPVPAGTTSYSNVAIDKKVNSYAYNDQIVNQKQTLFTTGDYIIHDGFPFDKASIVGGSLNITASILSTAITPISRPSVLSTNPNEIPSSDHRYIPYSGDFSSFSYPSNSVYTWANHNGGTKPLQVFNDTSHTYVPDLLTGNSALNPSSNAKRLKLATPDAAIPPLTEIDSVSFKTNDLMYPGVYNPYKVDGTNANDFTTLMVLYPDFVPSAVAKSTVSGEETNWYGIMSQATYTGTLATDIANWKGYKAENPRLSVRYKIDGTVGLYLGDALLTAIKPKGGVNRPFQPIIIGLTITADDSSATLIVVDNEIHRSTVKYTKNWLGATPVVPNTMLYGSVPFNNLLHSSKMYVLEINHYYSTHTDLFFNSEIQKMDKMYAITSGRV